MTQESENPERVWNPDMATTTALEIANLANAARASQVEPEPKLLQYFTPMRTLQYEDCAYNVHSNASVCLGSSHNIMIMLKPLIYLLDYNEKLSRLEQGATIGQLFTCQPLSCSQECFFLVGERTI